INCVAEERNPLDLRSEWGRYRDTVLEKSPEDYAAMERLLSAEGRYPAVAFYELLEHALGKEATAESFIAAAKRVWGFFSEQATQAEKKAFLAGLSGYGSGCRTGDSVKSFLRKLAVKYDQSELMRSTYFLF
ncbi:MAG: DUF1722 domain-containing protein, partial [Clostridia bacterium]|nr:DUF1722 domain-containing protein [Clostridia bacterium]